MNAHFFDLDTLIRVENSVWVVSKIKPNIPLLKISPSEFKMIKNGIYRKYNCPLIIGDKSYWLPENLLSEIKIKCKTNKCDITDVVFSMQEFMNPEIIESLNYSILKDNFIHLKNTSDDIYVISSKNTETNYESVIKKLESYLFDLGVKIKKFYHISETFYNRDEDEISHKKVRLLVQHLVGFKTDVDKFADESIEKYDTIYFYDDDPSTINLAKDVNSLLYLLISNTKNTHSDNIKNNLKSGDHYLVINKVTHNKIQPFLTNKIVLKVSNIAKTFESFKYRF